MNILILSRLSTATGNSSTACRLRDYFSNGGHTCILCGPKEFKDDDALSSLLIEQHVQLIIGIHAYRSGRLLTGVSVPYVIVFGGTDLHLTYKDDDKLVTMTKAVQGARSLVAFCPSMKKRAVELWPNSEDKIFVQAQGVSNCIPSSFSLDSFLKDDAKCKGIHVKDMITFLMVSGLRPIKDPLFLREAFTAWNAKDPRMHLIIIGPELDKEFSKHVKEEIKRSHGVLHIPCLPPCDLYAAMKSSFAVVNTSVNEGMAGAVLEAMLIGTVVMTRDNAGNLDIVRNMDNGLVFSTPSEFIEQAKMLMSSPTTAKKVSSNAMSYVQSKHSTVVERDFYLKLAEGIE